MWFTFFVQLSCYREQSSETDRDFMFPSSEMCNIEFLLNFSMWFTLLMGVVTG